MCWTIITGALASVTALLIAFGAYPWQKQQDRKLQLQLEKDALGGGPNSADLRY